MRRRADPLALIDFATARTTGDALFNVPQHIDRTVDTQPRWNLTIATVATQIRAAGANRASTSEHRKGREKQQHGTPKLAH